MDEKSLKALFSSISVSVIRVDIFSGSCRLLLSRLTLIASCCCNGGDGKFHQEL